MKTLTIGNSQERINLIIEQQKWIIGNNQERKWHIKNLIKLYFSKIDSEERKENNNSPILELDSSPVDTKRTFYYEVNDMFSINEECKLGSKSILAKVFEARLNEMDLFNTVQTINILFESLSEEMEDEQFNIKVEFAQMVSKQLIKLMKPYYIDELQKDEFDLSLEEIYLIQLQMIIELQKYYLYEEYIIVLDVKVITERMLDKINQLEDTYCLIFTDSLSKEKDVKNVALNEDVLLDFANSDHIYALFGEVNGIRMPYEEVEKMIEKYIEGTYTYESNGIINKIMHYFSTNNH